MQTLKLIRGETSESGTFGELWMGNEFLCVTCEDPWHQNMRGNSCIPRGLYECKPHSGQKYKNVWEVCDVPGRSAILIHNGNTISDTQGCILVGKAKGVFPGGMPGITHSRETLDMLRHKLPSYFRIEITEAFNNV